MFRFLKTAASPAVGNTAQPMRPPVQEYDFETPDTRIVRSSMPGIDAMDSCLPPSKTIRSYTSSEYTRTSGDVRDLITPAISSSCARLATPPVGFEGKLM